MENCATRANRSQVLNVTIVGGGLVGSLCACYMAKRGHNVKVFEYRDDIRISQSDYGRSMNMSLSTRARIALKQVNLEEDLLNNYAIPTFGRMIHSRKGKLKHMLYDPKTKQTTYSIVRKELNEVLLTAAEKYPNLNINFSHKLIKYNMENGKATFLRLYDHNIVEISSDFVIGADGAYSAVRRSMINEPLFNYSQEYIDHGYMELTIPQTENKEITMDTKYLHIWPRGEFMMIALPNLDQTWTVTLFMSFEKFNELSSPSKLIDFFNANFSDALPLMGKEKLIEDFFNTKPFSLVTVKCEPYHFGNKTVLIGDAAHAMVPFYGQGVNAGFEDCYILDKLMEKYSNNLKQVLPEFSAMRCGDGDAICDLAMYNYKEMRDLVNQRSFLFRKKLDNVLNMLLPNVWIPLYTTITFSNMSYRQCKENRIWQDKVLRNSAFFVIVLSVTAAAIVLKIIL